MSAEENVKKAHLVARIQDNVAASRELVKDVQRLTLHSQVLQKQAQRLRAQSQQTRGLTVAEACHHLGVCEHTLRRALREPKLRTRVIEQNRRVGIYHKFILVLPVDLVADLSARFAGRKSRKAKLSQS